MSSLCRAGALWHMLCVVLMTLSAAPGCSNPQQDARIRELIVQLQSGDEVKRMNAAEELMRIGPPARAAVPALIENLGEGRRNQLVNVAATNALLRIGPGSSLAPLIAALDGDDPEIAAGAAITIGGYGRGGRPAVSALTKAMQKPNLRESATVALRMIEEMP
jgi:HEAT repeat protein